MNMSPTFPPEFEHFFDHTRAQRLSFPHCRTCRRFHWYPMKRCPHCRSDDLDWQQVRGPATLFSWTVVRHAFDPKFSDRLPYVVGLVEFADAPGVRLVTNIVEAPEGRIAIGMLLEPVFEATNAERPLVRFRPAGSKSMN